MRIKTPTALKATFMKNNLLKRTRSQKVLLGNSLLNIGGKMSKVKMVEVNRAGIDRASLKGLQQHVTKALMIATTLFVSACGTANKDASSAVSVERDALEGFIIELSSETTTLTIANPIGLARVDEVIFIPVATLPRGISSQTPIVLLDDTKVLKHEWVDGTQLAIQVSLAPNETKTLSFVVLNNGSQQQEVSDTAYAELAVRFGGTLDDKQRFKGGQYVQMDSFTLPSDHTIGNKLFKYEGFGWESELVGYRYYFDNRGAIDVFAKQKPGLALANVGLDGGDYHALAPWGMDVLKVGGSLGLGAVAANHNDDIVKVSDFIGSKATVSNGSVFSGITLEAEGWKVGDKRYNLSAKYRIAGGTRLTEVTAFAQGSESSNFSHWASGIVDHNVDVIDSIETGQWCYRASYGKQSLNDDNLGLALFYECKYNKLENELNIAVSMNTDLAHYYFLAAWEAEDIRFGQQKGFVNYLDEEQAKLNNPITVK